MTSAFTLFLRYLFISLKCFPSLLAFVFILGWLFLASNYTFSCYLLLYRLKLIQANNSETIVRTLKPDLRIFPADACEQLAVLNDNEWFFSLISLFTTFAFLIYFWSSFWFSEYYFLIVKMILNRTWTIRSWKCSCVQSVVWIASTIISTNWNEDISRIFYTIFSL